MCRRIFLRWCTNDVERRLYEHENGRNPKVYTYKRRPLKLVFTERFLTPSQAIEFEKQVKGCRREKKIALINGEWDKLLELSRRSLRVPQGDGSSSDGSSSI